MELLVPESAGADMRAPLAGAVAYVLIVRLLMLREMSGRSAPCAEKWCVQARMAHALLIAVGSAALSCAAIAIAIQRLTTESDPTWLVCEEAPSAGFRGAAWPCAYAFYVTKYVEMLGTVIVLLGGNRPPQLVLHVYSKALGPFLVWGCLPSPVVRASPAPCARAHPHPPRDRTPTHRSRAVPPRTQSLQLVFVAVGAASQAINYGALVRYGEPGWLKSTLTMRCNLVACTTLLLGVAATLVMTALGHECAGVVPLLFASVFGLSIIPALVRRLQQASPKSD